MPTSNDNAQGPTPLRRRAEDLLKAGTPPPTRLATPGAEALSLLYRMATQPEGASEALKLLHELQVHQVELDLQLEQLEQTRHELTRDLDLYVERFDLAPVALLAVERNGRITDANLAAAGLLGVERDALRGRGIDQVVTPQSRATLLASLMGLGDARSSESCRVHIDGSDGVQRVMQVAARVSPSNGSFLLSLIETSGRGNLDRDV